MVRKSGEVRLSDIAKECGVSVVTAAKVLNHSGGSNTRVGAATAARISAVAQRLNYRPNLSARNLRSGDSRMIGILIDSAMVGALARTLAEIERCADRRGYRIMVAEEHDKVSNVIAGYLSFRQYGAAGVICISHDYPELGEELYSFFAQAPKVVFIGKSRLDNVTYVDIEFEQSSRIALEYLWAQGRRRIALMIDPIHYVALDKRRDGFKRTLNELCGEWSDCGRIFDLRAESESLAIKKAVTDCLDSGLLAWHPDAVIAAGDEYAGYTIRELQMRHLRVPEEIAVIGYGNDRFAEILKPALASIDDDQVGQGAAAVELLCRMLESSDEGALTAEERVIAIPPKLILRESAGFNRHA